MTVTDNSTEWIAAVQLEAATRLLQAAFVLQTEMKQNLSTSYPPASMPGEYPHGRTWGGRDGCVVQPDTPEGIVQTGYVRIGFLQNAWYIPYLEMEKGRLGLFHCYELLKPQLDRIISGSKAP